MFVESLETHTRSVSSMPKVARSLFHQQSASTSYEPVSDQDSQDTSMKSSGQKGHGSRTQEPDS